MRLREIKKKIEEFGSDGKITISLKQSLGNFYVISDSRKLFSLLQLLSEQEWSNADYTQIQTIINEKHALDNDEIMLDNSQYNQINAYINKINEKLPIFFDIVNSLSNEQGKFDINIKLSEGIRTIEDLNELVSEIKKLDKFANLDGKNLEFNGFDVGSWWITLSASCGAVYGFIMACTKLAQEVLKTQEQYYKTKEAKIHYRMSLNESEQFTETGLKKYCDDYCKKYLEQGATEIAKGIGKYNGSSENEIVEKAKQTTEGLLKIIGSGNEIHISLNGNQIVSEADNGDIRMNYEALKTIADEEKEEVKQLKASASATKEIKNDTPDGDDNM